MGKSNPTNFRFSIRKMFWLTICAACFLRWLDHVAASADNGYFLHGKAIYNAGILVLIFMGYDSGMAIGQSVAFSRKGAHIGTDKIVNMNSGKSVCRIEGGVIVVKGDIVTMTKWPFVASHARRSDYYKVDCTLAN